MPIPNPAPEREKRETIWCVFDADGYECCSLVGVFTSESNAKNIAADLQQQAQAEWDRLNRKGTLGPMARRFSAETWEVNKLKDCLFWREESTQ